MFTSEVFPFDTPLAIVEYRDFRDVPRVILVAGGPGYWMLNASFDDELDDFSPDYALSFAGSDREQARTSFDRVCKGQMTADVVDRIACGRVEFDPTRRRELRCHRS